MKVELAKLSDVNAIMQICDAARKIMHENGNLNQWINGYPSREIITADIENGHGFVILKNNEIKGYFCFFKGNDPEPTYSNIKDGKWLNNEPYGVIHRLASDGTAKGIADLCFENCFNQIDNIKVDTHHDNKIMQNYFEKKGFTYCGIINVNDGSERKAYQKYLPNKK